VSSVLGPRQHSIGYMGDGFYRSKDPSNSIEVLKERINYRKRIEIVSIGLSQVYCELFCNCFVLQNFGKKCIFLNFSTKNIRNTKINESQW